MGRELPCSAPTVPSNWQANMLWTYMNGLTLGNGRTPVSIVTRPSLLLRRSVKFTLKVLVSPLNGERSTFISERSHIRNAMQVTLYFYSFFTFAFIFQSAELRYRIYTFPEI